MNREIIERINLLEVKDYFDMRINGYASVEAWKSVKGLNLPNKQTLWNMLGELPNYIPSYEPSIEQINAISEKL